MPVIGYFLFITGSFLLCVFISNCSSIHLWMHVYIGSSFGLLYKKNYCKHQCVSHCVNVPFSLILGKYLGMRFLGCRVSMYVICKNYILFQIDDTIFHSLQECQEFHLLSNSNSQGIFFSLSFVCVFAIPIGMWLHNIEFLIAFLLQCKMQGDMQRKLYGKGKINQDKKQRCREKTLRVYSSHLYSSTCLRF